MSKKKLALILIGILIITGCTGRKEEGKVLENYENDFKNYLKTKYERPFETIEITRGSRYLGGPIVIYAEMFPLGEEKLIFSVSVVEGESKYTENYLENKWKRDADELIQNRIKTIFTSDVEYQFLFSVKENLLKQEVIDKQQQTLSYALREYNDELVPFIQIVDSEENVDSEKKLTELYEFISFLHESNLQNTRISLETYSSDYRDEIERNPRKFLEMSDSERIRYKQEETIILSILLRESDTASIKSKEDLFQIYHVNH